jgi:hypothetical protein
MAGKAAAFGILLALGAPSGSARADESGTSFWQPGSFGGLAATASPMGWSLSLSGYHGAAYAGSSVSSARLTRVGYLEETQVGNVTATSASFSNLATLTPTYGFAIPALGAQASLSLSGLYGHSSDKESGTLLANLGYAGLAQTFGFGDSVTGVGDLSPQFALYWSHDVHNFMLYATGNVPTGAYKKTRLSNIGIGHGAADAGAGYTYLNQDADWQWSVVAGSTYNMMNPSTYYRSGVDFHVDAGASKYLTKDLFLGPVGYYYDEIGCDNGPGDTSGCFRSRVAGVGAEIGYNFPMGPTQASLDLRGYGEFGATNRPAAWNGRLTFSVSPR